VLALEKNVDCLLIAKPVAFNTLEDPPRLMLSYFGEPVVGSSLWRPWSLLPATGRSVSKICEIGEQGDLTLLAFELQPKRMKVCGMHSGTKGWIVLLTMKDELPNEKVTLWSRLSCVASSGVQGRKVVTWLILPVVICLSQRLSHACLSINKFVLWNCEWLIKSVIVYLMLPCYMDNCGNSRANTCNQAPTSGRGVFIR
jgi:hypothetical protein